MIRNTEVYKKLIGEWYTVNNRLFYHKHEDIPNGRSHYAIVAGLNTPNPKCVRCEETPPKELIVYYKLVKYNEKNVVEMGI